MGTGFLPALYGACCVEPGMKKKYSICHSCPLFVASSEGHALCCERTEHLELVAAFLADGEAGEDEVPQDCVRYMEYVVLTQDRK